MTPEQIESERAKFEAWAKPDSWQARREDNGLYSESEMGAAFSGWLAHAALARTQRREMQETEQRLRAEIARLQAVASRAVPSESHAPVLETMQIWDIFQQGKWWAAMVSPIGWDAHCVKEDMKRQGYSSELTVAARKVIAADASPVVALMARNAELEAMLAAAPQPQGGTP